MPDNPWISVVERLPPEGRLVEALEKTTGLVCQASLFRFRWWINGWYATAFISHWREITEKAT